MAMNNRNTQKSQPLVQMKLNNTPETSGNLIKKIELENKQTLVLSDLSRKISPDAQVVILRAAMEINVAPDLFENEPLPDISFEQIHKALGDKVCYEYRMARNFILNHEKDGVLESLVDTFLKNMGPYISHPRFAPRLVLKQYRDKK